MDEDTVLIHPDFRVIALANRYFFSLLIFLSRLAHHALL